VTLDDLKNVLTPHLPQYDLDDYTELFFYETYTSDPETICCDNGLRTILKVYKTKSITKLIISLSTPAKPFSAWTFKDVISEYKLSESTNIKIDTLLPFTDIRAAPLDSDLEKQVLDQLINEIRSRVDVLDLTTAKEATKSVIISSFLIAATKLFEKDMYLICQQNLKGHRGHGPVDFSVHSRMISSSYALGVTEVKRENFEQGVAQNIVQLESALTENKKRKRKTHDIDGEEEPPMKVRSYGIVTDASQWMLTECALYENGVSYRATRLKQNIDFNGNWQDDTKFIFERLV
jgi:hypothetical protein